MSVPDVGDIMWVEFDPVIGSEQAKRRPALVLTNEDYHLRSPRAIVCPISSAPHRWAFNVRMPSDMRTKGSVLVDQVRTIHRDGCMFRLIERAPMQLVSDVRAALSALLSIEISSLTRGVEH